MFYAPTGRTCAGVGPLCWILDIHLPPSIPPSQNFRASRIFRLQRGRGKCNFPHVPEEWFPLGLFFGVPRAGAVALSRRLHYFAKMFCTFVQNI